MTDISDTKNRYGYGSIFLHWTVAAVGLYLAWTGYDFMFLPRGAEKGAALAAHLAAGWIAIVFVAARIAWRLGNRLPALAAGPTWQRHAARTVHWTLLVLIAGLALTGYMAATTGNRAIDIYGLFVAPPIFGQGGPLHGWSEEVHSWLSHIFVAVLGLHIAAALKRTFVDKDGTLQRMLHIDRRA